jgi:hypothetical protein
MTVSTNQVRLTMRMGTRGLITAKRARPTMRTKASTVLSAYYWRKMARDSATSAPSTLNMHSTRSHHAANSTCKLWRNAATGTCHLYGAADDVEGILALNLEISKDESRTCNLLNGCHQKN